MYIGETGRKFEKRIKDTYFWNDTKTYQMEQKYYMKKKRKILLEYVDTQKKTP